MCSHHIILMTACLCQLMDTIEIKMDHGTQNKTFYLYYTATSEHTSAISCGQGSHILRPGGSLQLHLSPADFGFS